MNFFKTAIAICSFMMAGAAFAGEKGTAEEAISMVKKAIQYIKDHGKEKAFAEFNNPNGSFKDRDLYIFVFDMNGTSLAHGALPKLIGKPVGGVKDADGKVIFKAYVDTINAKGKGWVDYRWPNPVSGKIEQKSSYVEKFDEMVIGAGIYKD